MTGLGMIKVSGAQKIWGTENRHASEKGVEKAQRHIVILGDRGVFENTQYHDGHVYGIKLER